MIQSLIFDNLSVLCTELQENDTIFYVFKLIKIRCLLYLFSCLWRYFSNKNKKIISYLSVEINMAD
jgi:hypothetical protein